MLVTLQIQLKLLPLPNLTGRSLLAGINYISSALLLLNVFAFGSLNTFQHCIKNDVSNTIFMIKYGLNFVSIIKECSATYCNIVYKNL
jgi:hypothetical protein